MSKEDVFEYKMRRHKRYLSIVSKIDFYIENSEDYKSVDAKKILLETYNYIKKYSNIERISCGKDNVEIVKSIQLDESYSNIFIDKIIENLRSAGEYIIEKELLEQNKEFKKQFDINLIKNNKILQDNTIKAIKTLMNFSKVQKIDILEKELFEMSKDIKSCIGYNSKIDKISKNMERS